jgi:DNA polymerase-3 subunit epsilon
MSRAVLFDTETTGLEPWLGHRIIEVAALELLNDLPTGRHFHALIHPDKLIAHNAPFDFGFLDAEFERIGRPTLSAARMIDTLALAKVRFPGMPNSLDALCRRFAIDLSARSTHNALLDCRLLAEVYVELTGGRQRDLSLAMEKAAVDIVVYTHTGDRAPRPIVPTVQELAAHAAFVERLRNPIWLRA